MPCPYNVNYQPNASVMRCRCNLASPNRWYNVRDRCVCNVKPYSDDPHARMHFMTAGADLEIGFARHRLCQVHTGRRRAARIKRIDDADDVVLHSLEPPNRLAKLHARPAVLHRHLVHLLTRADFVGAQNRNRLHGGGIQGFPALSLIAKQRIRRHLNVVKAHLIHLAAPARQRPHRHPRHIFRDYQQRNAVRAVARSGAHGANQMRCNLGIVHEQLDTIERVLPALPRRLQLNLFRLPAMIWLGDGHCQKLFPSRNPRQDGLLLRFCPRLHHDQCPQDPRGKMRSKHWSPAQLLKQHCRIGKRPAAAVVCLRDENAEPAETGRLSQQLRCDTGWRLLQPHQDFFTILLLHKARRRRLQQLLLFRQSEIHTLSCPLG